MAEPVKPNLKSKPWMKVALGVSLALNLAVAGVLVGGALRSHHDGPRQNMVRELNFGPFTDALSTADRQALRADFFARAPEWRQARLQMRGDMSAILTALRADPFDPAALAVAITKQSDRISRQISLGQELLSQRIAAMTPQERAGFADRLEDGMMRRRDRQAAKKAAKED